MWILALGDYFQRFKRNIFIALQISVVLFMTIIMMSTFLEEYRLYKPIEDCDGKQGIVFENYGFHPVDTKNLLEGTKDVEKIITHGIVNVEHRETETYLQGAVYNKDLVKSFQPELSKGEWLNPDSNITQVVISENDKNWDVGDIITFVQEVPQEDGTSQEVIIKAQVCGKIQEGTTIWGKQLGEGGQYHLDYRDLYSTYRYEQEQSILLMFSEEQLKKNDINVDYSYNYIISYKESITEKQASQNERIIMDNIKAESYGRDGFSYFLELESYMETTKREIMRNIIMYIPILICVFLVTVISLINVCTLNMRESYRQNAVFYLLGLHWRKCSIFACLQNIFTLIIAGIFTVLYVNLAELFQLKKYIFIKIYNETIWLMLVIVLILFIISMIIPMVMLRRKQPIDVIRQERV